MCVAWVSSLIWSDRGLSNPPVGFGHLVGDARRDDKHPTPTTCETGADESNSQAAPAGARLQRPPPSPFPCACAPTPPVPSPRPRSMHSSSHALDRLVMTWLGGWPQRLNVPTSRSSTRTRLDTCTHTRSTHHLPPLPTANPHHQPPTGNRRPPSSDRPDNHGTCAGPD